ncbi:thermonuclease family protein [Rhizobium sp. 1399]|uniref:thermonuclease family protein n=1 Tax=Rhizobium sp. 1399 TaxID=2817758 RepID=UPI00286AA37A|nr:thermonuclease family protein [Rhizobium sp. 1399]
MLCAFQCEPVQVGVWDGDTIRIESRSIERVRIFNIDAPELEGKCGYEIDLAFSSKSRLAEILQGQRVQIHRQGEDRYGRTLAALSVNGRDVGDQLVREGLARTWSGRREPWCR